jgi:hypothetical protein
VHRDLKRAARIRAVMQFLETILHPDPEEDTSR